MISLSRPARSLATGSQRRRFYSRLEGFANGSTARGARASLVKLCSGAHTSRQRPAGLGHHAYPRRLADFVDQNRSTVGQLAIPECDGRSFEGKIEGGMNPDQPSPAHDSELATVLVEKGLLATIEKSGFLGCGKHAPGSDMTKGPSTKRTTQRAAAAGCYARTAVARACPDQPADRRPSSSSSRYSEYRRTSARQIQLGPFAGRDGPPACG